MSESYTAWDDNLYEWPPPDGWYEASDGRWWPEGYGPAAEAAAVSSDGPAPTTATATASPAGRTNGHDPAWRPDPAPEGGPVFEDPERTSVFPAGGLSAEAASRTERLEAEGRRRVYDELPPIDDVFGGRDPYADDEEEPAPPAWDGARYDRTLDGPELDALAADLRAAAGPAYTADAAPDTADAGPDPAPAPPPPADAGSFRPGPAGPAPGPFDEIDVDSTTRLPLDLGPADFGAAPPAGPDARPVFGSDPGPAPGLPDPGLGGPGGGFGGAGFGSADSLAPPRPEPQLAGFDRRPLDVALDGAGAPRRSWPLVVIGVAVTAVVILGTLYFLLRGNSANGARGVDTSSSARGSFNQPYDFGIGVVVFYNDQTSGQERRWVIQVLTPVSDATRQLVDNAKAAAPGNGEVLALTRVRVTYQSGPAPGSVADLRLNAIGSSKKKLTTSDACSAVADPLQLAASLNVLESVEGNLCWKTPAADLDSLKLAVEAGPAAGTVHLALH